MFQRSYNQNIWDRRRESAPGRDPEGVGAPSPHIFAVKSNMVQPRRCRMVCCLGTPQVWKHLSVRKLRWQGIHLEGTEQPVAESVRIRPPQSICQYRVVVPTWIRMSPGLCIVRRKCQCSRVQGPQLRSQNIPCPWPWCQLRLLGSCNYPWQCREQYSSCRIVDRLSEVCLGRLW
jgi:hypothetical protein